MDKGYCEIKEEEKDGYRQDLDHRFGDGKIEKLLFVSSDLSINVRQNCTGE